MAAAAALAWSPVPAGGSGPSPDFVDVVACRLDVSPAEIRELRDLLAPDEVARALRLRLGHLRDTFVVGRGRLRQILGLATGYPPATLSLGVDPGGKPRLDSPPGDRLRFNVSHSRGLMLCAVGIDRPLGIDVEHVSLDTEWEDLATRFLASAERRAIAALSLAARRSAFFDCWTRKEAVLKATGDGLTRPLGSFAVSVDPQQAEVLACDPALGRPESWLLAPLPVGPGYRAAVAVHDGRGRVSLRLWAWDRG